LTRFLAHRLLSTLLVLLGLSVVIFALARVTGDPSYLLLPVDARPDDIARYRALLGLDRPWLEQYGTFLQGLVRGDFGVSFRHRSPALGLVLERLPATTVLAGCAFLVATIVPVALGSWSAARRDSWLDGAIRIAAVSLQAVPTFWLGIVLILVVSVWWGMLPAAGAGDARHLVLPTLTLAAYFVGTNTRLVRSSMLEVLSADYIRTAHAKGATPRRVMIRHAWRNAAIPLTTVLGLQLGALLSGAVITETVFAYPGMGLLAVTSILGRDFPVVQAFVLLAGLIVTGTNLVVDVLYALIDPRIRYHG
jgi:peptide/nickel transport system permease protein